MIAVDTNLLVYAFRADMPFHARAREVIESNLVARAPWAVCWPSIHEFIAVVTNPRIFKTPTPVDIALAQVDELNAPGNLLLLGENDGYLDRLRDLAGPARVQGGLIHDARIAALCLVHGVRELWTADRDFSRFPGLKTRNPMLD